MSVQHNQLTGADLHEPKGVASAVVGTSYVADGAGSGAWSDIRSRILLSTQTASSSATINFVLTSYLATYKKFEIEVEDVVPATDGVFFWFRTSTDGGSTYASSSANYSYALISSYSGAPGNGTFSGNNSTAISMTSNLSNVSGDSLSGIVTLFNPAGTKKFKMLSDFVYNAQDDAVIVQRVSVAGCRNATADVDAVRFLMSTGNIASGSFRLYGLRTS